MIIQCSSDDQSTGTHYYLAARDGDGGGEGYLRVQSGTFEIAQASDESRKEDIRLASLDATDMLRSIPIHEFRYKRKAVPKGAPASPKAPMHRAGFVAQQVEAAFPEMVGDGPDGFKTVSPTRLIPVLVKAIQELADEIAELKGRRADAVNGR